MWDPLRDTSVRAARIWSNKELKRIASCFAGSILHVSAWEDKDKQGSYYKNYFNSADEYYLSNYGGERGRQGYENEIYLDLAGELPEELINRFDVVFNHTTLEHIYNVKKAFKNLCSLSKDVVILVVPFMQKQHETVSFKDYWRFTPTCLKAMFYENGMETVYESTNDSKNKVVYLFIVGSSNPEKWTNVLPSSQQLSNIGSWLGHNRMTRFHSLLRRLNIAKY
jgi:hypothetical protein